MLLKHLRGLGWQKCVSYQPEAPSESGSKDLGRYNGFSVFGLLKVQCELFSHFVSQHRGNEWQITIKIHMALDIAYFLSKEQEIWFIYV